MEYIYVLIVLCLTLFQLGPGPSSVTPGILPTPMGPAPPGMYPGHMPMNPMMPPFMQAHR